MTFTPVARISSCVRSWSDQDARLGSRRDRCLDGDAGERAARLGARRGSHAVRGQLGIRFVEIVGGTASGLDDHADGDLGRLTTKPPRQPANRAAAPAHLERVANPIAVPTAQRPYPRCGSERTCIGHDSMLTRPDPEAQRGGLPGFTLARASRSPQIFASPGSSGSRRISVIPASLMRQAAVSNPRSFTRSLTARESP